MLRRDFLIIYDRSQINDTDDKISVFYIIGQKNIITSIEDHDSVVELFSLIEATTVITNVPRYNKQINMHALTSLLLRIIG